MTNGHSCPLWVPDLILCGAIGFFLWSGFIWLDLRKYGKALEAVQKEIDDAQDD